MANDVVITELFKLWIEKNPDQLKDASPEEIIEAWDKFKKRLEAKRSKDHPTEAYSTPL